MVSLTVVVSKQINIMDRAYLALKVILTPVSLKTVRSTVRESLTSKRVINMTVLTSMELKRVMENTYMPQGSTTRVIGKITNSMEMEKSKMQKEECSNVYMRMENSSGKLNNTIICHKS